MTYIEERLAALERQVAELQERVDELAGRREVPELLSTTETARMLDVSPQTIKNWITDGKLPAHKVGRHWKIDRAVVLERMGVDHGDE